MQVYKYAIMLVGNYSKMQIMQIMQIMQVFKEANMQAHKYTSD